MKIRPARRPYWARQRIGMHRVTKRPENRGKSFNGRRPRRYAIDGDLKALRALQKEEKPFIAGEAQSSRRSATVQAAVKSETEVPVYDQEEVQKRFAELEDKASRAETGHGLVLSPSRQAMAGSLSRGSDLSIPMATNCSQGHGSPHLHPLLQPRDDENSRAKRLRASGSLRMTGDPTLPAGVSTRSQSPFRRQNCSFHQLVGVPPADSARQVHEGLASYDHRPSSPSLLEELVGNRSWYSWGTAGDSNAFDAGCQPGLPLERVIGSGYAGIGPGFSQPSRQDDKNERMNAGYLSDDELSLSEWLHNDAPKSK